MPDPQLASNLSGNEETWLIRILETPTLVSNTEIKLTYAFSSQIEREAAYSQFTMIIITGIRDIHINSIREDDGSSLARNLAHVYHFYLFGERGRSGNMRLPSLANSRIPVSLRLWYAKLPLHCLDTLSVHLTSFPSECKRKKWPRFFCKINFFPKCCCQVTCDGLGTGNALCHFGFLKPG